MTIQCLKAIFYIAFINNKNKEIWNIEETIMKQ